MDCLMLSPDEGESGALPNISGVRTGLVDPRSVRSRAPVCAK
jgi:hypothetical protein